jgi:D-threo-aldose 1-dehydrogenase
VRQRKLGNTGLEVGIVGWGGAGITLYEEAPDDQVFAVLDRALELGVNFWDTAPLYGRGRSETLIGRYLAGMRGGPQPIVATKVGYLPEGFDYSYDAAMRGLEGSLKRLGLDRLALVHLHDIERAPLERSMGRQGAFQALRRMQNEGVIEHIGVSGGPPDVLLAAIETREFATVLTHNRYNLLDDSAGQRLIPRAAELGMGVINGGPFATGILATGPTPGAHVGYREAPPEVLERVATMQEFFEANGLKLLEAAIGFSLANPNISVTIPGARSPQELEDAVAVSEFDLEEVAKVCAAWREEEAALAEEARSQAEDERGS